MTAIQDMYEAIADQTVPGEFSADRTVFSFPLLKYYDSKGKVRNWQIRVSLLDAQGESVPIEESFLKQPVPRLEGYTGVTETDSYLEGSEPTKGKHPTHVTEGKNWLRDKQTGQLRAKKNATNPITQALRDAYGKHAKQLKTAKLVSEIGSNSDFGIGVNSDFGIGVNSDFGIGVNSDFGTGSSPDFGTGSSPDFGTEIGTRSDAEIGMSSENEPDALRPLPMLLKREGATKSATLTAKDFVTGPKSDHAPFGGLTAQEKLDGIRMVAYRDARTAPTGAPTAVPTGAPTAVLYKRTGDVATGMEHLQAEIGRLLDNPPPITKEWLIKHGRDAEGIVQEVLDAYKPPRPYVDGELFTRGKSRRWISGQGRRTNDDKTIDYFIFDVFFPYAKEEGIDMPSALRQAYLDDLFARLPQEEIEHLFRVPNHPVANRGELDTLLEKIVGEGGEGVVVRKNWEPYQYSLRNYHSDNVVKIKPTFDGEFEIVGYDEGKGKFKGAVRFEMKIENPLTKKDTFMAVPSWPIAEARKFYECLQRKDGNVTYFDKYIKGAKMTVEYDSLSDKTNLPVQPHAVNIRTDIDGAGAGEDPSKVASAAARVREFYEKCGIRTD